MQVISSFDVFTNKTKKVNKSNILGYSSGNFWQPLQMLEDQYKTYEWCVQYMEWADWTGMQQIRARCNWMMKNYKLAIGEIEKSDYIKENSEYADMMGAMEQQAGTPLEAMSLKFYPLANTVINVLVDEFSKRASHMSFDDTSEQARNEMLEEKMKEVGMTLESHALMIQQRKMIELGLSEESEEGQQMVSQQAIKSLPEIQEFYDKSYRNIYQEWAQHQMEADTKRFMLPEMERKQFRNMLITDREFWHFRMMESDYEIEMWNPPQVFYRKTAGCPYISDAIRVGYAEYMTVPDVIDRDGYKMSEEQLLTLNTVYGARQYQYALDATMQDNKWNKGESYEWNRTGPGLATREALSVLDGIGGPNGVGGGGAYNGDIIRMITDESEDVYNYSGEYMVRRTTVYWKTQRKFYHLTKIDEYGNEIQQVVGEDYKVTTKPLYNETVYKGKNKENLIYGEHLDALWANEVWGGVRIGTNIPSIGWQGTANNTFAPIYLGITGPKPGRLPFQFKSDRNIYGCKLPVEGAIFTDHNTKSRALIDNLKPWQIGYNMANNMLQDTMVNDLGVLMQLDPNALAKHSLGNDMGPDILQSTLTIARDLSVIQAYGAGRGQDGEHIGQHPIQRLDLSQTERILGLAKIAQYFKEEGLASVGLNQNRLGTPIEKEETATGVQQQVAASYSHTEYLYTQHCDELMPRVHQMRTDLAQYYNCTNPSVRLQYLNSSDKPAWFEVNGTELLGRDINVRCTTRVNARNILQQIKQLLLTNNTSGANLYDLVRGIQIPTVTDMNQFMKHLEKRQIEERQREMEYEQQQAQAEQEHQMQLEQQKQQYEADEKEKDRQARIYEAEIQAASRAALAKPSDAGEKAYQEGLDRVEAQQQFQETMNLDREKHLTQTQLERQKLTLQEKKVQAENARTNQELQVARIQHKVKEKEAKNKKK